MSGFGEAQERDMILLVGSYSDSQPESLVKLASILGKKLTVGVLIDKTVTDPDIVKKISFPLIIKPAGLASSLLVRLCYHREELEPALAKTIRKIKSVYKKKNGRGEPRILVEEFMEGSMYSIDSYVNQRGVVYHTPL